jgi:glycosyltransferase involved in cell wall biosynthesis
VKVGFFSPLPPARTGVADYSAALLRRLRELGAVDVNAEDADVGLYHLGNNQLHREIYERALRKPGVAVLHDAVLHHFFLGTLGETEYIREFAYNYGAWSEEHARELWRTRARSATDPRYFRYPMLKRIAEVSKAIIVHNPAAAEMVRRHAPMAMIHEVPHLFEPPQLPPQYEVERLRAKLGVSASTLLCGVFGHLRESKRILPILRAFAQARRQADVALVVAGDFVSTDLARASVPLLESQGIIRIGYTPEDQFWLWAAITDVCINLRYPAAGETSGIAIRLMGIGKTVIVTAGPETARFPETGCLRVDPGEAEEEMLAEYLVWLARNSEDARAIGRCAQAYVLEHHAADRVASMYWDILSGAGIFACRRL